MAADRLEALRNLVEQNPGNELARFGLAMEYAGLGRAEEAISSFKELLAVNPDYWGAYYHFGQVLESAARLDEARAVYQAGIEVTARLGQKHANSELETALDLLG
jgi:tetratricopeptide (TPR) repeat protein